MDPCYGPALSYDTAFIILLYSGSIQSQTLYVQPYSSPSSPALMDIISLSNI